MDALDRGDAVDAGQPDVDQHDLRVVARDSLQRLLARFDSSHQLEVVELAEQQVKALAHDRVVVHAQAASPCSHSAMVQRLSLCRLNSLGLRSKCI